MSTRLFGRYDILSMYILKVKNPRSQTGRDSSFDTVIVVFLCFATYDRRIFPPLWPADLTPLLHPPLLYIWRDRKISHAYNVYYSPFSTQNGAWFLPIFCLRKYPHDDDDDADDNDDDDSPPPQCQMTKSSDDCHLAQLPQESPIWLDPHQAFGRFPASFPRCTRSAHRVLPVHPDFPAAISDVALRIASAVCPSRLYFSVSDGRSGRLWIEGFDVRLRFGEGKQVIADLTISAHVDCRPARKPSAI